MIQIRNSTPLQKATISAVSFDGLTVTTHDGRPAMLAIIDEQGEVIEAGGNVAAAAWNVSINCHSQFLTGSGHLRVFSPPAMVVGEKAAA